MSENSTAPILQADGLTKRFGKATAIAHVSLDLPPGRIVGLLGPNGSGKTTLIKLVAGLLTPTSGEIKIDGQSPGQKSKAIVSYLPDTSFFDERMKVSAALNFFDDFFGDFERTAAEEMLKQLSIDPAALIKTLSKGNKEKMQIVLTMSRKAKLYLLDEPIGGVDPAARDYILQTIIANYNTEGSVLISTHLIGDIEKVLDDVIFLKSGIVERHQSVDDLRAAEGAGVEKVFKEVFKC